MNNRSAMRNWRLHSAVARNKTKEVGKTSSRQSCWPVIPPITLTELRPEAAVDIQDARCRRLARGESTMNATKAANAELSTARDTDPPATPPVVDRATFQAELDALRAREKAHTYAGDAIAAARRR